MLTLSSSPSGTHQSFIRLLMPKIGNTCFEHNIMLLKRNRYTSFCCIFLLIRIIAPSRRSIRDSLRNTGFSSQHCKITHEPCAFLSLSSAQLLSLACWKSENVTDFCYLSETFFPSLIAVIFFSSNSMAVFNSTYCVVPS